jgi:phenylacetate-coenzyme A ligase PaaK-like adenylate-forming protein
MDGIPNYLAYFQHSFDLEPGYKRLYFSEGHVVEDMRRKFKYKKKNIPAYRRLFEALKRQDDLKKLPKKADEEEMEMGVEE